MRVHFFEAALVDLKDSLDYYSEIEIELGDYFLSDIKRALSDIKEQPNSCPEHSTYSHLRLKTCKRFPFTIIYHPVLSNKEIYIVAVAHQKRNPNYWNDRIDN